jgi:hypothetical protein
MKLFVRTAIPAVALSALVLLAGCTSTGAQNVEATSERLGEFRTNVEKLKTEVSSAAASLATLVENANNDPKPAAKKFNSDAEAVESSYDSAKDRLAKVRADADKLFVTWSENAKSISDPELQRLSEERRKKLGDALENFMKQGQEALDEMKPFVHTNKDLMKYLAQDMTPAGIEGLKGKSKDQSKAAESIAEELDDLIEATSKTSTEFATATPPPKP